MERDPRRLVISSRLSLAEMRGVAEVVEKLKLPAKTGSPSEAVRAVVLAVLAKQTPEYTSWPAQECAEWLASHGYDFTQADRNRRALSHSVSAEQEEELEHPDLLSALRPASSPSQPAEASQPSQPAEALTTEQIEQEAAEVGEKLDEIFARLEQEERAAK